MYYKGLINNGWKCLIRDALLAAFLGINKERERLRSNERSKKYNWRYS